MKDLKCEEPEQEEKTDKEGKPVKPKAKKSIRERIIDQNVKVKTQEIGPRMVLQLRDFYSGVFNTIEGKYEYHYRADYFVKRNNFFL